MVLFFPFTAYYAPFTNGYEYSYHSQQLNWEDSRAVCIADGGDLASIHTRAENEFVYNLWPNRRTPRWLGATLIRTSSPQTAPFKFAWSDGTPMDVFSIPGNFYNRNANCIRTSTPSACLWTISEPNDFVGHGPNCIRMGLAFPLKALPYEWNDGSCSELASFVCKRRSGMVSA